MHALSDVYVKHVQNHGDFLCVNVYGPDTQQLSAMVWLCSLYGFEKDFQGGRFQKYCPTPQANAVTILRSFCEINKPYLMKGKQSGSWFSRCIEWINDDASPVWSFDVKATMEDADGEPDLWFTFSFSDVDDAVLFKLKFS